MLTKEQVRKWMNLYNEEIQANKTYLSELDTPIGDGDHGNNMARGMQAVMEALKDEEGEAADLLKKIAMTLLSKVGGASGPLYGSAFIGMAKVAAQEQATLADYVTAGLEGIQKRGKAETGEKTMVDVWAPAAEAAAANSLSDSAIDGFVEATKAMKATKGRASYLGERSIGHIDPGAFSSGLLFKTLLKAGVQP